MSEEQRPGEISFGDLNAYRIALAALEAEKARLMAKYDARIEGLKKAIAELEQQPVEAPSEQREKRPPKAKEEPASRPQRARKGTPRRS
jgi:hypothetical protein